MSIVHENIVCTSGVRACTRVYVCKRMYLLYYVCLRVCACGCACVSVCGCVLVCMCLFVLLCVLVWKSWTCRRTITCACAYVHGTTMTMRAVCVCMCVCVYARVEGNTIWINIQGVYIMREWDTKPRIRPKGAHKWKWNRSARVCRRRRRRHRFVHVYTQVKEKIDTKRLARVRALFPSFFPIGRPSRSNGRMWTLRDSGWFFRDR